MLTIATAVAIFGDVVLAQAKLFLDGKNVRIKNTARQGHPVEIIVKTEHFRAAARVSEG
jgi:hypothetical protein